MKKTQIKLMLLSLLLSEAMILSVSIKNINQVKDQKQQIQKNNKQMKELIHDNKYKNKIINKLNNEIKKDNKQLDDYKNKVRELENKNQELKKARLSRGSGVSSIGKKIKVHVSYYTNANNSLEGGYKDKRGKLLTSHEGKVCAMPSNISYGSKLYIPNMGTYKVVDSGGAIQWIDNNTCKVDVFVPNVSTEWLNNNSNNKIVDAILYEKR